MYMEMLDVKEFPFITIQTQLTLDKSTRGTWSNFCFLFSVVSISFLFSLHSSYQNVLTLPHQCVLFPPFSCSKIVSNNLHTSLSGTTWGFQHLSYDQGAQLLHHPLGTQTMHKKSFSCSCLSLLCALHSCISH